MYVCKESLQESPLLDRHSTNENGEHCLSSGLHGKDEQMLLILIRDQMPSVIIIMTVKPVWCVSVQYTMLCI